MPSIKRIGVLTSGGDAPGMNAAIRAVVRTGIYHGLEVYGIFKGYSGLIQGLIEPMHSRSVSNIIQRGGTILKTARSEEFRTQEGRKKAHENLIKHNIDAMVVIGGDGTFTGAKIFQEEFNFPIVGLPGTIDNDLYGTDYTIGYDTAVNTVVEAVDKIRDTADSHDRLFIIEVMGRDAGFIALRSGIATGAEKILIPESVTYTDELIEKLRTDYANNKTSGIIIVAEGDDLGGGFDVARVIKEHFPQYDTRVTILGHVQRGGSPSAFDRTMASAMGYQAVLALKDGVRGVMVGSINRKVSYTPFEKAIKLHQSINEELLEIAEVLSH
ncbi:MAG: 6-phosphofructokinase [Bacteroidales bacterium]|jgi:6-phosphofructokinase 1|nr:6-phosphofructokinase [Bacteroidales bacterium]